MGTHFLATKECAIHQIFKNIIIESYETDTMVIQRSIRNTARAYKNKPAKRVLKIEAEETNLEQLME